MKEWIEPRINSRELPDLEFSSELEKIQFPLMGFIPFRTIVAFGVVMQKAKEKRYVVG